MYIPVSIKLEKKIILPGHTEKRYSNFDCCGPVNSELTIYIL